LLGNISPAVIRHTEPIVIVAAADARERTAEA
jgi:hypothetical protein